MAMLRGCAAALAMSALTPLLLLLLLPPPAAGKEAATRRSHQGPGHRNSLAQVARREVLKHGARKRASSRSDRGNNIIIVFHEYESMDDCALRSGGKSWALMQGRCINLRTLEKNYSAPGLPRTENISYIRLESHDFAISGCEDPECSNCTDTFKAEAELGHCGPSLLGFKGAYWQQQREEPVNYEAHKFQRIPGISIREYESKDDCIHRSGGKIWGIPPESCVDLEAISKRYNKPWPGLLGGIHGQYVKWDPDKKVIEACADEAGTDCKDVDGLFPAGSCGFSFTGFGAAFWHHEGEEPVNTDITGHPHSHQEEHVHVIVMHEYASEEDCYLRSEGKSWELEEGQCLELAAIAKRLGFSGSEKYGHKPYIRLTSDSHKAIEGCDDAACSSHCEHLGGLAYPGLCGGSLLGAAKAFWQHPYPAQDPVNYDAKAKFQRIPTGHLLHSSEEANSSDPEHKQADEKNSSDPDLTQTRKQAEHQLENHENTARQTPLSSSQPDTSAEHKQDKAPSVSTRVNVGVGVGVKVHGLKG